MAGSLNKVLLIGRLGTDPEIKQMVNGKSVARFSLATSNTWKDKNTGERKEKTEWHRVVIFNEGLVNVVQQYVKKGAQVYIEGQLTTRKWRDENSTDTSAVLYLFKAEYSDHKFLSSELREKRVYDEQIIKRLKGILLELFMERRELWSDLYNKFKNDYSAEKDTEKLTEEEVLEQMHGSPELKGLDEYIASFCVLGNKSQSQEIIKEHLKTRK